MSSKAVPLIIILVLVGGIVTWGALTDWTFSGLLPREGATCTPADDDKIANASEYKYDDLMKCTKVKKCKTGWLVRTDQKGCTSVQYGKDCIPSVKKDNVANYKFGSSGLCNVIAKCKEGAELNASKTACVIKEGATCTTPVEAIDNATAYETDPGGNCTLVQECETGFRPADDLKTCIDEWVLPTKSKLSKYQALGYPVNDDDKDPGFTELKATTIEGCRSEAKTKGAQMIGYRSLGNLNMEKSCWAYTDPDMDTSIYGMPTTPQPAYWVECVDTSNNAATSLCTKASTN